MKKIVLVFSMLVAFSFAKAQGVRVGIKGGGNTTWLLNQNVFDADERIDHEATFGANVGASVTYMFTDMLGLSLDIIYTGVNQKYNGEVKILGTTESYTIKEKLRYIDLPLMLKLTSDKGPYFEIGPKISMLTGQREEIDFDDADFSKFGSNGNFKNDYNSLVFSIALGFGVDIKVAENMFVTAGLRLAYNPGDALKKKSEDQLNEQALKNEDHTVLQQYSFYKDGDATGGDAEYKYAKTHIATGGLVVGFCYEFGGK